MTDPSRFAQTPQRFSTSDKSPSRKVSSKRPLRLTIPSLSPTSTSVLHEKLSETKTEPARRTLVHLNLIHTTKRHGKNSRACRERSSILAYSEVYNYSTTITSLQHPLKFHLTDHLHLQFLRIIQLTPRILSLNNVIRLFAD